MSTFKNKLEQLFAEHEVLLSRKNEPLISGNGIITRYKYPVVTAEHTPVFGGMILMKRQILFWWNVLALMQR